MNRIFFYSLWFVTFTAEAQNVQWASQLIDFSSEYKDKDVPENSTRYAATQVLGYPNTARYGESVLAWAVGKSQAGKEHITVGFGMPQTVQQVMVGESYNAGAIKEIILYDAKGKDYSVYENKHPSPTQKFDDILTYFKIKPVYNVVKLKLVLNTDAVGGMQQIDCIGISSAVQPYKPVINVVKYSEPIGMPENLGAAVNTEYYDHLPIVAPDGQTLYFARKFAEGNVGKDHKDDIYYSGLMPSGKWGKAVNIGEPLNTDMHNYVCFVSTDNKRLYLANKYRSQEGGVSMSNRKNDGSWSKPKALNIADYYNKNEYSAHHLSLDENVLLMCVQRDEGYGDLDIYVSFKYADGNWSTPANLGPMINTVGAEASVFLAADNKTIYFSSCGRQGFGSYDMYMSKRLDQSWKKWSEPLNLGPQINTPKMDIYYTIPPNGDYIYYSSEDSYFGKNDLYRIRLPKEARPEPVDMAKILANAPLKSEIPVVSSLDTKLAQLKQQQKSQPAASTPVASTATPAPSTADDLQKKIEALKQQQQQPAASAVISPVPSSPAAPVVKKEVVNSIQPYTPPKEAPKPLTQQEIAAQRQMKNNPAVNPEKDELTQLSRRDMPVPVQTTSNSSTAGRPSPSANIIIHEVEPSALTTSPTEQPLKTAPDAATDALQQKLDALKQQQKEAAQQQSTRLYEDPYKTKPYSPQPVKEYQEDPAAQDYDAYKKKLEALKQQQRSIPPAAVNTPAQQSVEPAVLNKPVVTASTVSSQPVPVSSGTNPVIAKYEEKLRKLKEEMAGIGTPPAVAVPAKPGTPDAMPEITTPVVYVPSDRTDAQELEKPVMAVTDKPLSSDIPQPETAAVNAITTPVPESSVATTANSEQLEAEKARLDSIQQAQKLASQNLTDMLDKLGTSKQTLEKDIDDLQDQRSRFSQEKDKLTAQNSELVTEKEKLEAEKMKMDELLAQMQAERDKLAAEKLKMEQDKAKLDALKKQQEREVLGLKRSIDSLSRVQQTASTNAQLQQKYDLFSVPLEVGAVAQVNNIYFVADAAFLQIPSYPELDKLVMFLKKNNALKVEIGGHTNGLCDDVFCQKLSTSRAKTCVDYLISKGIDAGRLSYKGYGKTQLLMPQKPENALNQRVEIKILSVK